MTPKTGGNTRAYSAGVIGGATGQTATPSHQFAQYRFNALDEVLLFDATRRDVSRMVASDGWRVDGQIQQQLVGLDVIIGSAALGDVGLAKPEGAAMRAQMIQAAIPEILDDAPSDNSQASAREVPSMAPWLFRPRLDLVLCVLGPDLAISQLTKPMPILHSRLLKRDHGTSSMWVVPRVAPRRSESTRSKNSSTQRYFAM